MQRNRLLALIVIGSFSTPSIADVYPTRPIRMVIPFAEGAPVDQVGRLFAERMQARLGQSIEFQNVAGFAGTVAVNLAARAPADGYTVSLGNLSSHVLNGAMRRLPYDALKDFEPVALLGSNPQLILSRTGIPADDLNGLATWLKIHPDKATVGTGGSGGVAHVSALLFQKATATRFRFEHYRGTNLALQDLIRGQIDLVFDQPISALSHIRAGTVKAYAVTANSRLAVASDIPTVDEAGLPSFYVSVWNGLWVPKGTPNAVIAKLSAATIDAMEDLGVRKKLGELGMDIPPPDQRTPEALGALHKTEIEKWLPIIQAAKITQD